MTDSEAIQSTDNNMARRIGPFTIRRWLVILGFGILVLLMMGEVLDPYGEKGYMEINHGDHKHYVPEDRDPNVSISAFPTSPPGPNEKILPNGQIVPK